MNPDFPYLTSPHICLCILLPSKLKPNLKETPKPNKTKAIKANKRRVGRILPWELYCGLVSHTVWHFIFTWSHWSDLRPLVSAKPQIMGPHWGSSQISCWAMSWRSCCFGYIGLYPSQAPTVHRFRGCWGRPTHNPDSGYVLASSPALPQPHHHGELSSTVPTCAPNKTGSKG